ncbi:MAG TPA: hypothetical protein VFG73_07945 [Rhodanobacteraceae bacterium]|nr:hypothetical protein [Rhodanobacteraceae bacterium]
MALALWLLLGEPLTRLRSGRALLAALRRGRAAARRRFYLQWPAQGWLLGLVVLALGVGGWTPAQLGLRWPTLSLSPWSGLAAGALAALLGGALAGALAARRANAQGDASTPLIDAELQQMLPRGRDERLAFALLALTAGITEELVWRGVLLVTLSAVWPAGPSLPGPARHACHRRTRRRVRGPLPRHRQPAAAHARAHARRPPRAAASPGAAAGLWRGR